MTQAFHTVAKFTRFWQKIIIFHALALRKKVIPSVLADSEDQEKFSCFMYSSFVFLKDPIRITEFFLLLNFKPDIDLKASNTLISSLNDFKEPYNANVASSANSVLLNSLQKLVFLLNLYFLLQLQPAVPCM